MCQIKANRKNKEVFSSYIKYDELQAKNILIKFISNLENIHRSETGELFFYGGTVVPQKHLKKNDKDKTVIVGVETRNNIEYLEGIEREIMNIFKGETNWSNMRKSKHRVGNMIKWLVRNINRESYPHKKTYHMTYRLYFVTLYVLPKYCNSNVYLDYKPSYIENDLLELD